MAFWALRRSSTTLKKNSGYVQKILDPYCGNHSSTGACSCNHHDQRCREPPSHLARLSSARRLFSAKSQTKLDFMYNTLHDDHDTDHRHHHHQGYDDFPGGKVMFTSELSFLAERSEKRVPCFRVLDDSGQPLHSSNSYEQAPQIRAD
ncbi:hypothetical protein Ancab_037417 [Ancistrocladus abbreviatus]